MRSGRDSSASPGSAKAIEPPSESLGDHEEEGETRDRTLSRDEVEASKVRLVEEVLDGEVVLLGCRAVDAVSVVPSSPPPLADWVLFPFSSTSAILARLPWVVREQNPFSCILSPAPNSRFSVPPPLPRGMRSCPEPVGNA
jgi:hypothetical protein